LTRVVARALAPTACRQQSANALLRNLQEHRQQLEAARGQRLALFGVHQQLRRAVDSNTCVVSPRPWRRTQTRCRGLAQCRARPTTKCAVTPRVRACVRACVCCDARRRRFERVPIGPLGAHLSLTDNKWSYAAEQVLGPQLELWLVHSPRDEAVRGRCCWRVCGRVSVQGAARGLACEHVCVLCCCAVHAPDAACCCAALRRCAHTHTHTHTRARARAHVHRTTHTGAA
jgi:hypothetical protein